jgi:Flp pilus assembly protein TadG
MLGIRRPAGDEGAAAVEFALIVTPLLVMVAGLVSFGIVFNANIAVTHAAHEGARLSAITPTGDVTGRVIDTAAPAVTLDASNIQNPSCGEVTVTYSVPTPLLSLIGIPDVAVEGYGVERCYSTP